MITVSAVVTSDSDTIAKFLRNTETTVSIPEVTGKSSYCFSYPTRRNVAGSIPDEVSGCFN
jgi:hypothetical protein